MNARILGRIAAALAGLATAGCSLLGSPDRSRPSSVSGLTVTAPRAWMEAPRALEALGRQGGMRYAVAAEDLRGPVGPFAVGEKVGASRLLSRVAEATGTELVWCSGVPVLQPRLSSEARAELGSALADIKSTDARERRRAAFALGEGRRLEAVPALVGALGDEDRSVRRAALLGLAGFEGDFDHGQWAGRDSIFELADVKAKLDADALMWLVEEAAPAGGDEWTAAVSILSRAGERQLPRAIWQYPWNRVSGTTLPVIRAVGRCGDPDVRAMLEKRIRETFTNEPADRYEVAAALGCLGMVESLKAHALVKEKGGQPPEVRAAAAYGLGFCKGSAAALEVLKSALADPDRRVREVAVFAMGEMGSEAAGKVLAGLLADEKVEAAARCAAAGALGRSGGEQNSGPLAAALKAADPRVQAAAAEALGALGGPGALEALAPLRGEGADRWVQAARAHALACLGADPGARLAALLADPEADPEVKLGAVIGMGQSRSPIWTAALARVALDPKEGHRLRQYAARSLAPLADRAGQPGLRQLLEAEPPVRLTDVPLRFLDLGNAEETTRCLARWLTGGSPEEQQLAAERIAELGTPEGVGLMVGAFDAFNNHTRFTQEWSLVVSRSPAARRALTGWLRESRRSGVRMNAALALAGRRDPEAVDALIAATGDEKPDVRKAAANALGECGDPAAAPALVELLEKDPDIGVAHQALRALRLREFASLPEVAAAFARVKGTGHDCGIPGGPPLAAQPDNSWVLRRWPADYDDRSIVDLTYESALVYDPAGERVVQWGAHGRRADFPQTGRTWIYDPRANSWRRTTPRQEPPGTCLTRGLTMDPVRGLVISPSGVGGGHGWVMALRKHACYSVPWLFDCAAEQWTPAHTLFHPGSATEASSCFDLRDDVMLLNGHPLVYDPHANCWTQPEVSGSPTRLVNAPGAYDPVTGRFLLVADADSAGRARIWAFDLPSLRWTELGAANPPPAMAHTPMVYDPANDVFLAFRRETDRIAVWAYRPRENRWEDLPAVYPSPSYGQFDVAFDPERNVAVISGGWEWGQSTAVTTRETWTYRYKSPEAARQSTAPRNLKIELAAATGGGATASLSWDAPPAFAPGASVFAQASPDKTAGKPAGAPGGYHVWRGVGEHPWTAKYERLTQAPVKDTKFSAPLAAGAGLGYFRVFAVGADGKEGEPSNLARTQPEAVREVFCARGADGKMSVAWTPSRGSGVIGYNVYRAPCDLADLWRQTFDPEKNEKKGHELVKLNDAPVSGTTFTDTQPTGEARPVSESSWPALYVYVVKAVNVLGQEGGASPATLSIPAAPGPVVAVNLPDGRCLAVSGSSGPLEPAERGRWLYRMDSFKSDWAFRTRGAPRAGCVLVDDSSWPVNDRRCYFVIATDASGQLGAPGAEAWVRNAP